MVSASPGFRQKNDETKEKTNKFKQCRDGASKHAKTSKNTHLMQKHFIQIYIIY